MRKGLKQFRGKSRKWVKVVIIILENEVSTWYLFCSPNLLHLFLFANVKHVKVSLHQFIYSKIFVLLSAVEQFSCITERSCNLLLFGVNWGKNQHTCVNLSTSNMAHIWYNIWYKSSLIYSCKVCDIKCFYKDSSLFKERVLTHTPVVILFLSVVLCLDSWWSPPFPPLNTCEDHFSPATCRRHSQACSQISAGPIIAVQLELRDIFSWSHDWNVSEGRPFFLCQKFHLINPLCLLLLQLTRESTI